MRLYFLADFAGEARPRTGKVEKCRYQAGQWYDQVPAGDAERALQVLAAVEIVQAPGCKCLLAGEHVVRRAIQKGAIPCPKHGA